MFEADSFLLAALMGLSLLRLGAGLFLTLAAIIYLGIPLWIRSQQTMEAQTKVLPIDLKDHNWPADMQQLFEDSTQELSQHGFDVVQAAFLPSATPLIKTVLILLVNRTQKDMAMVTAMCSTEESAGGIKNFYVEFSTRLEDGSHYDTMNSAELPAFPKPHDVVRTQLVEVADPGRLYEIHQAILNRDSRQTNQKVLRLDRDYSGDAIAYLQRVIQDEFESATEYGYLTLSEDSQNYLMTLKGAYLMVWGQLWPFKPLRGYLRDRNADKLLATLN